MDDLALTPEGDARRAKILRDAKTFGHDAAIENFPSLDGASAAECKKRLPILLEEVLRDDAKMANLDLTVKKKMTAVTEAVTKACMPHGLLRKFPDNHMQTMTMSGAKGSAVNARQISCGLGQQELEGRRVPTMVSGKTLPSFKAFETAAIAGGYIASRFLTGIRPQEFYFHCMAGREGLIDTAVKTSRSGYLQRCLIKHLEGLKVHYDGTVRGSDAAVLQFAYGGDGLDVTRQKHLLAVGGGVERTKLQNALFEFALRNDRALRARLDVRSVQGRMEEHAAAEHMKKALKKPHKYPPAMSIYRPSTHIGSTSETYAAALDTYVKENPHKLIQPKKKDQVEDPKWESRHSPVPAAVFKMLMNVRYLRSLAEPGEAVGLLASQGCVTDAWVIGSGYMRYMILTTWFVQCRRAVDTDDTQHLPFRRYVYALNSSQLWLNLDSNRTRCRKRYTRYPPSARNRNDSIHETQNTHHDTSPPHTPSKLSPPRTYTLPNHILHKTSITLDSRCSHVAHHG